MFYCSDQSELLWSNGRILKGTAINTGYPSRWGLTNLGPLFYYWIALLDLLSAGNVIILKLLYASSFIGGISTFVLAQRRIFGAVFFPLAAALTLYFHPLAAHFINILWGPSMLLVLFPLLFLVCLLVLEGRWHFLPVWVAIGSFTVQTHFSSGPPVFFIGLVIVFFLLFDLNRQGDGERGQRIIRALMWSAIVFILLWTPTVI